MRLAEFKKASSILLIPADWERMEKQEVLQAKSIMNAVQSEMVKCYGRIKDVSSVSNDTLFGEKPGIIKGSDDDPDLTGTNFTKRVFDLAGIDEEPYLVLFYTLKYEGKKKNNEELHDAYTVISVLYWSKDSEKPIFFNFDTNSWEEGSLYTAEFMFRGKNEKEMKNKYNGYLKNQILPGHKYDKRYVRIYVLWNKTGFNQITDINDKIESAMGIS